MTPDTPTGPVVHDPVVTDVTDMTSSADGTESTDATQPAGTSDVISSRPSLAARGLSGAVRVYQLAAAGRPSPCRHVPSCSTYAIEALDAHGAVRGSWLAVRRLGRCHPWGTSGYDPVPPPREARR